MDNLLPLILHLPSTTSFRWLDGMGGSVGALRNCAHAQLGQSGTMGYRRQCCAAVGGGVRRVRTCSCGACGLGVGKGRGGHQGARERERREEEAHRGARIVAVVGVEEEQEKVEIVLALLVFEIVVMMVS